MENESIEVRVSRLQNDKEEIEDEMKMIEKVIEELKEMKDKVTIKEVQVKVNTFINDLEYDKEICEDIKNQIEKDIIFIKGVQK